MSHKVGKVLNNLQGFQLLVSSIHLLAYDCGWAHSHSAPKPSPEAQLPTEWVMDTVSWSIYIYTYIYTYIYIYIYILHILMRPTAET